MTRPVNIRVLNAEGVSERRPQDEITAGIVRPSAHGGPVDIWLLSEIAWADLDAPPARHLADRARRWRHVDDERGPLCADQRRDSTCHRHLTASGPRRASHREPSPPATAATGRVRDRSNLPAALPASGNERTHPMSSPRYAWAKLNAYGIILAGLALLGAFAIPYPSPHPGN